MNKSVLNLKLVILITVFNLFLSTCTGSQQAVFYVSNKGSDNNPGSQAKPFKTIQKAAEVMQPGDACFVREGVYRETIHPVGMGISDKPMRFEAYKNEKVVLDGTEKINGEWKIWKGNIYHIKVSVGFEQLFFDGKMMVEARWPNMIFPDQLWNKETWANSKIDSRYGKMVDSDLAATKINWTGAVAILNVAHQFQTWTRKVLSNQTGTDSFTYQKNLEPITSYADKTKEWEDDKYYLAGKLEALDMPGEWFLDSLAMELYFRVPDDRDPNKHEISYKVRDYGFDVSGKEFIELKGFNFFGTTIRFIDCNNCLVENCRIIYPIFSREFNDPLLKKEPVETILKGNHNRFIHNAISFAQITGLNIIGANNLIENNIIHDVAWSGQGFGINMKTTTDDGNIVTKNTIFNTGYSAISPGGKGNWTVSYNHLHHCALVAKDCAVIQTGNWEIRGSSIHNNWVHDCYASGDHPGGLKGGLGIRGDDQTRGLTVHHNVVWNCGRDGIIVKGDDNKVYNNTVLNIGSNGLEGNYISMHTEPEPYKPWRTQAPLLEVQNRNSKIFNNATFNISGDRERNPYTPAENLQTNFYGKEKELKLIDPINCRFTPKSDSPLIDTGTHISGLTDGFKGKAPDIGAYEFGDTWQPGADWSPESPK
jgi:hypothetical protein